MRYGGGERQQNVKQDEQASHNEVDMHAEQKHVRSADGMMERRINGGEGRRRESSSADGLKDESTIT